jgi:hypothetical protein
MNAALTTLPATIYFNSQGFHETGTVGGLPTLYKLEPLRFSREQQAADIDRQRTRLVKDCLTVGRWKVNLDDAGNPIFWDITPDFLIGLEEIFCYQKSKGVAKTHNLVFTHGTEADPLNAFGVREIHPRDIIANIDQLFYENGRLWFSVYVTPTEASLLKRESMWVSVRILPNWEDGSGERYGYTLTNVGVVDHPVIFDQQPFFEMDNKQPTKSVSSPTPKKGLTAMPLTLNMEFKALVEGINALLPDNLDLPKETSEETFPTAFEMAVAMVSGNKPEPKTPEQSGTPVPAAPVDVPAELRNLVPAGTKLTPGEVATMRVVAQLSNQVAALQAGQAVSNESAYRAKLVELGGRGIDAATIEALTVSGQKTNWDLTLLNAYDGQTATVPPAVELGNKSKTLATPNAPKSTGVAGKMSDNDRADAMAMLGIRPKK